MILAKNGNIAQSVALPSLYKGNIAGVEDEWRLVFEHGEITYKEGELNIKSSSKLNIETEDANIKASSVKVDAENIIIAGEDGGGVVCQNHICSFTGGPHPQGSSKIKGAM